MCRWRPCSRTFSASRSACASSPKRSIASLRWTCASESGTDRSTLLHRLVLLGVPWGKLAEAGRSRGTFRERWVLRWEPEFAVQLVENLIHGATIAQAAAGRMRAELSQATELKHLADLVLAALTARLPDAVESGIALIERHAA